LGLAGVDVKLRSIADEVAYWLDDALDAVEAGKLRVANKAKIKIENDLIRRKKSSAVQIRLEKIELEKKERMRAETVKHDAEKYR
jgi:dGTP triphosphohydrolase